MKNSNDTIGNQTRKFPACSSVLQPTAPLRAPSFHLQEEKNLVLAAFPPKRMDSVQNKNK
jgi:hypothetical protein